MNYKMHSCSGIYAILQSQTKIERNSTMRMREMFAFFECLLQAEQRKKELAPEQLISTIGNENKQQMAPKIRNAMRMRRTF